MKSKNSFALGALVAIALSVLLAATLDPNSGYYKNLSVSQTNHVHELVVTNNASVAGNLSVSGTNNVSTQVVTNNATVGGNFSVTGTNYANELVVTQAISAATLNVSGAINLSNPYTPPVYTVATLPVGSQGQYAYCTDAITYSGTGGYIFFNGSYWEIDTASHVQATNNVTSYMLDCCRRGVTVTTSITHARMLDTIVGFGATGRGGSYGDSMGSMISSGTASSTDSSSATNRPYATLDTGTTTTGSASNNGWSWFPAAGDMYLQGMCIKVNALSVTGDRYWSLTGIGSTANTYSAYAVDWLYDLWNTTGDNAGASVNWLLVTRTNSVSTVLDSGHAVDTSFHSLICLFTGTTNQAFYFDGVPIATNAVTINAARYYVNRAQVTKTTGSTDEQIQISWVYNHLRFAAARSFFP